jgi:hypothetical protein
MISWMVRVTDRDLPWLGGTFWIKEKASVKLLRVRSGNSRSPIKATTSLRVPSKLPKELGR